MAECMSAGCYRKTGGCARAQRSVHAVCCAAAVTPGSRPGCGRKLWPQDARILHLPLSPVPRPAAFDGSPVTCYCLLVNVPKGQAYSLGHRRSAAPVTCEQDPGFTISGEYTAPLGNAR